MMTLIEDKHALVKNDLLHARFSSAGTHMVNTLPNIKAGGFTSPEEAPPSTTATGQDSVWQEAVSPHLTVVGRRTVQGAG
jgi:hypothetical protein